MASFFYQYGHLRHRVFQPQTIPETHPPPSLDQVDLTISIRLTFVPHDCITNQIGDLNINRILQQETLRFDLDVLKNHDQVHLTLGPALTRLGVNPISRFSVNFAHEIIERGLAFGNLASNRGRKVLPLRAELWGTLLVHVRANSIRRALTEWASEFQARNYGMVPANESSVKNMLKKVCMEIGDQDCMICLEELKVGSDVSRMPCSHTFHGDCIEKWLKQSHYCPICRFEMLA
ncbi:E3 ubiquitin-protein ligase AMFR-like [Durio zibethinus]|uniref:RING-type E3 ubiquitin transferase n=1 Tax=Durio zibethinus TaxID=66656 RepID=A0A6P5Y5F5_DURZI|nr:E3 ubiquitin-protein ligase AMFR-like [Durio zibethinus]